LSFALQPSQSTLLDQRRDLAAGGATSPSALEAPPSIFVTGEQLSESNPTQAVLGVRPQLGPRDPRGERLDEAQIESEVHREPRAVDRGLDLHHADDLARGVDEVQTFVAKAER
jgi:hypothetical protein